MRALIITCILFSFLLPSYSIYQATTPVPTTFENKNELNASGSISGGGIFTNLAYSPIKYTFIHTEGGISPFTNPTSYTYSARPGVYYPISPKFQMEAQLSLRRGVFGWSDSFVGSSDSFTSGEGDYSYWNTSFSLNYTYKKPYFVGLLLGIVMLNKL